MSMVKKSASALVAGMILMLAIGSAQAAMVNFTLSGTVDGSDGAYGLSVGSTITASGVFDNSAVSVAPYTVYFDQAHSGNTLTITAGTLILSNSQDQAYAAGGSPKLEFSSGVSLIGFGYNVGFMDGSSFDSGALAFILNDANFNFVTGSWNAASLTMTPVTAPVPVPAAVWLLGSGLLGLVGIVRRRWRA